MNRKEQLENKWATKEGLSKDEKIELCDLLIAENEKKKR